MSPVAIAWSVLALLAWGGAAIFDKLALNSMKGLSSLSAVIVRMVFAVLFMLIIALAMGEVGAVRTVKPITCAFLALSALFGAVIGQGAYYYATSTGQVSKVVSFTAAYPLVTVILAIAFLHEPFTARKLLATAMIVVGLVTLAVFRDGKLIVAVRREPE